MVERFLGKEKVEGPIPSEGSPIPDSFVIRAVKYAGRLGIGRWAITVSTVAVVDVRDES